MSNAAQTRDAPALDRGASDFDPAGQLVKVRDIETRDDRQGEEDPIAWINDGRRCLGRLYADRRGFRAELDDGTIVGVFTTLALARSKLLFRSGDRLLEKRRSA
jgi:hypothetical protein